MIAGKPAKDEAYPDGLLNVWQAAEYLNCSTKTIYKLVAQSKRAIVAGREPLIEFSQHGRGNLKFYRHWLDAYIEQGRPMPDGRRRMKKRRKPFAAKQPLKTQDWAW